MACTAPQARSKPVFVKLGDTSITCVVTLVCMAGFPSILREVDMNSVLCVERGAACHPPTSQIMGRRRQCIDPQGSFSLSPPKQM